VYWNKLTTPGAVAPAVKTTATREFDLLQGFVTVTSKDTGGRAVVSRYNSLGVSDVTTPGQGKTQFLRDAAFSIQEVRNGANLRTVFSRDQFGRLSGSTTTKPSGSFTVSINKDSFNRFQGLSTSDGGAMSIVRGDFGEVSRQTLTYPGGEQRSFSFDRNGPAGFDLNKIFKITDENSNTSWINDYDVVTGKLLQKNVELNGQNIPTAFFQWNGGKLDKVVSGNGAEVAYSYDGFGRVTSKTVTQGSQLIDSTEVVERTQSGKVLRLAYPQSLSYKGRINRYDLLGRLTGYKLVPQLADLALAYDLAPSVQTVSYSYVATDPFRRSSVTVTGAGAGSKTYTLDAATGRYLAINGLAVTYDTLGNITRWGNTRYYYDTLDRLVKVDNTAGSVLALFTYGADGKLASVTTPNEGTKTLRWVGNKWYLSEDSAGLQQANITDPFDYNGLIGYFRKEGTAFPATYNFTSMDSNSAAMRGALTERYSYGPDGEFSLQGGGASQFGQPQGYHGGYRVSSAGVSYFDNRFKIDAAGIFTQPDPDPSYVMFYDVEPGDNHNYVDKDGRAPIPGNDNGAMPHNDRYEFRGIAENSRDTLAIKEQIGDTVIEAAAWTAAGTAAALPTAAVALYISTKDIIENGASFGNVAGAVGSALPFLPKSVTNAVGNSIGAATRGAKGVVSKGGRSISKASQTLFVGSAAERLWWKVSELPKTLSQSQNSLCKRCGDILEDQLWWRQQNKAVEPYLPTNPTIGQKSSLVQTNAAGLKLDSYTARAVEAKYVTIRDGQMFVAPHKNHVGSTINSYSNLARYNREYNISSSVAYKLRYRECNSVRISKKISSLNVGDIETANYYFNRNVDGARWRSDGGWVRPQDDYLVIMDTPKNLVADGATLSIDTLSVSASAPAIHVSGVKEVKVLAIYEPGTSWSMPDL
jgi:YD repeat-containing protein